VRPDAVDSASPGALPTTLVSPTASTPSTNTNVLAAEEAASRPLLTFVLVTLLAALGGALFLAFQKASLPDLPARPTPERANRASPAENPQKPNSDPSQTPAPR
jgi:hypothetical protein